MAWAFSLLFGIGLFVVGIFGLVLSATPWMTWLDLGVAAAALAAARELATPGTPERKAALPFALGVLLLLVGGIGLATGATAFLVWSSFGFAAAFLLLGFSRSWWFLPRVPVGAAVPYEEQSGTSHRFLAHDGECDPGDGIGTDTDDKPFRVA